jgi:hypothetical protein
LDGSPGSNGSNGSNGLDGFPGTNGSNGLDGSNGSNGLNGCPGSNGLDGSPGSNGLDGSPGSNGSNGLDGSNGSNGIDGKDGLDNTLGVGALPIYPSIDNFEALGINRYIKGEKESFLILPKYQIILYSANKKFIKLKNSSFVNMEYFNLDVSTKTASCRLFKQDENSNLIIIDTINHTNDTQLW